MRSVQRGLTHWVGGVLAAAGCAPQLRVDALHLLWVEALLIDVHRIAAAAAAQAATPAPAKALLQVAIKTNQVGVVYLNDTVPMSAVLTEEADVITAPPKEEEEEEE